MIRYLVNLLKFRKAWYLASYPDVREAVETGLFRSAFDHYRQFGMAEGRLPWPPAHFDEEWYLSVYGDAREAIGAGEFATAFEHFIQIGRSQGHLPAPLHQQISLWR